MHCIAMITEEGTFWLLCFWKPPLRLEFVGLGPMDRRAIGRELMDRDVGLDKASVLHQSV